MEFHPSKIPISKTFVVKDEKQATEAAHEMVMMGFDKEDKGYKVVMSKENEKTAKRIGYTVTTTVTYALRKTNQEEMYGIGHIMKIRIIMPWFLLVPGF